MKLQSPSKDIDLITLILSRAWDHSLCARYNLGGETQWQKQYAKERQTLRHETMIILRVVLTGTPYAPHQPLPDYQSAILRTASTRLRAQFVSHYTKRRRLTSSSAT